MKEMLRIDHLSKALRRALRSSRIGPRGIPPKYTASGSGFIIIGLALADVPSSFVGLAVIFLLGALVGAKPAFSSSFVASAIPVAIPFGRESFAPFSRASM